MSYGLSIPHIILPSFKAEQLYIKLDKKLTLHAKRIDVTLSNTDKKSDSFLERPRVTPIINIARKNFTSLIIDELNINNNRVTFSYIDKPLALQENYLNVSGEDVNASIGFQILKDHVLFNIEHFIHKPSSITIDGESVYDFTTGRSYTNLDFSMPGSADIALYLKGTPEEIAFTASSNVFHDLAPIVKLFKFDKNIYKWIVPYNLAESYHLLEAKGVHSYSDTDKILDTLYIHAKEKGLAYTYNERLPAVIGEDTDVYFSKGVLDIQPHKASYNQLPINKGGVIIDFSGKDIMLEVDLYANIPLEETIIKTLQAYKINLPLFQEKGISKSHVKIVINLDTNDAYATGQFFIKESDLLLDGVRYHVHNAAIRLHKNILNIDTAKLTYKNILKTDLTGRINLKDFEGDFYFDIDDIFLPLGKESGLKLKSKNPRIQLHFAKKAQSYILPKTRWQLDDINITADANEIFMQEKFSSVAKINKASIHVQDFLDFKASGLYDIGLDKAGLDINVSHFNYAKNDINISLQTSPVNLSLLYKNDEANLSLLADNTLVVNKEKIDIEATDFLFKEGYLDIYNTNITIKEVFSSNISSHYKLGSGNVVVQASNTTLLSKELLHIEPSFELLYHYVKGLHYLDIAKHGIHATLNRDDEMVIRIKDFNDLRPYSNTMKLYDIKDGHAELTFIDDRLGVDVIINNFYPLLSEDNKQVTDYTIKGDYSNNIATIQINKNLDFLYSKKAKLMAKNIGFNLFPILDYLKLIDTNDEGKSLDLIVKTKNCNVTLGDSGRKILSDTINMQVKKDKIFAQLVHNKGGVMFESNDHNISVFGRGLNDVFMNNLFKFSTFKGGSLSFAMQGPYDNMEGIMNIKDSTIEDYTVLNNTLAFFNTIPALVTFSVPNYSKDGLHIQEMYGSFHKLGPVVNVKEAKITSKELIITAKGKTDVEKETVDLLMEVKTDLGSTAKKIPLLGYIIFGEDSVSTTVKVSGDIKNPKVKSSVAKSIIVAPYNIIKRTLTFPFHALGLMDEDNTTAPE